MPTAPLPLTFSVSPSGFLPFLPLPRGGTTLHPARLGHRLPRRGPPTRLGVTQEPRRRRRPGGSVSAWSPHRPSSRTPGAGGKARLTPSTLCRQRRRQPEGEHVWPPIGGAGGAGPGVAERSARSPPAIASWAATPLTAHALDAAAGVYVCMHVHACACARVCLPLPPLSFSPRDKRHRAADSRGGNVRAQRSRPEAGARVGGAWGGSPGAECAPCRRGGGLA